ncbi:MAG: hypothetical protein ACI90V_004569 [Bacillariaceae sp.]|jgi:hypothetical protein
MKSETFFHTCDGHRNDDQIIILIISRLREILCIRKLLSVITHLFQISVQTMLFVQIEVFLFSFFFLVENITH